jgi:hypothetical protein
MEAKQHTVRVFLKSVRLVGLSCSKLKDRSQIKPVRAITINLHWANITFSLHKNIDVRWKLALDHLAPNYRDSVRMLRYTFFVLALTNESSAMRMSFDRVEESIAS